MEKKTLMGRPGYRRDLICGLSFFGHSERRKQEIQPETWIFKDILSFNLHLRYQIYKEKKKIAGYGAMPDKESYNYKCVLFTEDDLKQNNMDCKIRGYLFVKDVERNIHYQTCHFANDTILDCMQRIEDMENRGDKIIGFYVFPLEHENPEKKGFGIKLVSRETIAQEENERIYVPTSLKLEDRDSRHRNIRLSLSSQEERKNIEMQFRLSILYKLDDLISLQTEIRDELRRDK